MIFYPCDDPGLPHLNHTREQAPSTTATKPFTFVMDTISSAPPYHVAMIRPGCLTMRLDNFHPHQDAACLRVGLSAESLTPCSCYEHLGRYSWVFRSRTSRASVPNLGPVQCLRRTNASDEARTLGEPFCSICLGSRQDGAYLWTLSVPRSRSRTDHYPAVSRSTEKIIHDTAFDGTSR